MRSIVYAICLILVIVHENESAPTKQDDEKRGIDKIIQGLVMKSVDSEGEPPVPDLDYNSVKYDNVELKTEEISMEPAELIAKVLECIEKCRESMSKNSYRDKCLAKTCDIYKKKK